MHSHTFFHTQIQYNLSYHSKQKNIKSPSFPFADKDLLSNVSNSKDEEQDQHDLDIEIVPQDDLDPDPTPIPN